MIKLLIADDEPIVIDSIYFVVDKYVSDVEVVGSARSGREAIEKALQLKPDVLFMDIHMPGINGIEAIRHIQERCRDIIFVIITAYEYFQYAQEAVKLGVSEYLLKPINRSSIIETLEAAGAEIRARRERIKRETALMEQIGKVLPRMEGQFIYSQLCGGSLIEDMDFYEGIFEMKLTGGCVLVALLDGPAGGPGAVSKEERLLNSLGRQDLYEKFCMALKSTASCLVGPPLMDRIIVFIPQDEPGGLYEARNRAAEIAGAVMKKTGGGYRIGIGKTYKIEHFSQSYREACVAAACAGDSRIACFKDIRPCEPEPEPYPLACEERLLHKLMLGDLPGALQHFEELYTWLSLNYSSDLDRIKSRLTELFFLARRALPGSGKGAGESEGGFLRRLFGSPGIIELKIDFIDCLKNTVGESQGYRKREPGDLALKAMQYIEENYHKDITLDDAAREVNMSYHYFSKFFKESTGRNFVDYLTDLRLENAKQRLRAGRRSIKAISRETGYSDPNYFSKIFKKRTGMTPTDYRRAALPGGVTGTT